MSAMDAVFGVGHKLDAEGKVIERGFGNLADRVKKAAAAEVATPAPAPVVATTPAATQAVAAPVVETPVVAPVVATTPAATQAVAAPVVETPVVAPVVETPVPAETAAQKVEHALEHIAQAIEHEVSNL